MRRPWLLIGVMALLAAGMALMLAALPTDARPDADRVPVDDARYEAGDEVAGILVAPFTGVLKLRFE